MVELRMQRLQAADYLVCRRAVAGVQAEQVLDQLGTLRRQLRRDPVSIIDRLYMTARGPVHHSKKVNNDVWILACKSVTDVLISGRYLSPS